MTPAQKMNTFAFLRDVWARELVFVWDPDQDTAFNYYLNIVCPRNDPEREQFLADFSIFCG